MMHSESRQKKVALQSIGCRTNQAEIAELRAGLVHCGFQAVDGFEGADIIILNTCSVTGHTESKIMRLLGALSREAPQAGVLVTGCMAERKKAELLKVPNVGWVVGNGCKGKIPEILRSSPPGLFFKALEATPFQLAPALQPPAVGGRTRFHLKIQEGCNRRCAYCIVPFLRGPSRSAAADDVERSLHAALDAGYKEIVLTGTHIGQYRDSSGARLFPLVERLLGVGGDFRLRLSSIDGEEISDRFLTMVGEGGKLCDHLHVSLQSLSAGVLRRMNRPGVELDGMVERLAAFRARYPAAGLGADFIVGFPGETEAQFEETLANARKIGFSYAHIFRYSSRPGTAAAAMTDMAIPEAVKRERSARLRMVIARSADAFVVRQIGKTRRIIVEGSMAKGVTANYLTVDLDGISPLPNSWLDVIIEKSSGKGRQCTAVLPRRRRWVPCGD
jgi:threonylcarbamoyladenosine tRNA methylthiotransferase MtaB